VYLLSKEAEADLELSCDDEVVRNVPFEHKKEYSETILSTIKHTKMRSAAYTTYFYSGSNFMKHRFQNILDSKRKKNGLAVVVVIMAVVLYINALFTLDLQAYAGITRREANPWADQFDASFDVLSVTDFVTGTKKEYTDSDLIERLKAIVKDLKITDSAPDMQTVLSQLSHYIEFSNDNAAVSLSLPYIVTTDVNGTAVVYEVNNAYGVVTSINRTIAEYATDEGQVSEEPFDEEPLDFLLNNTSGIPTEGADLPDAGAGSAQDGVEPENPDADSPNDLEDGTKQPVQPAPTATPNIETQTPGATKKPAADQTPTPAPVVGTPAAGTPTPGGSARPTEETATATPANTVKPSATPKVLKPVIHNAMQDKTSKTGTSIIIETNNRVNKVKIFAGGELLAETDSYSEIYTSGASGRAWQLTLNLGSGEKTSIIIEAQGINVESAIKVLDVEPVKSEAPQILEVWYNSTSEKINITTNGSVSGVTVEVDGSAISLSSYDEKTVYYGTVQISWSLQLKSETYTRQAKIIAFDAAGNVVNDRLTINPQTDSTAATPEPTPTPAPVETPGSSETGQVTGEKTYAKVLTQSLDFGATLYAGVPYTAIIETNNDTQNVAWAVNGKWQPYAVDIGTGYKDGQEIRRWQLTFTGGYPGMYSLRVVADNGQLGTDYYHENTAIFYITLIEN